jgi:hypothetical protein
MANLGALRRPSHHGKILQHTDTSTLPRKKGL